MLIDIIIYCFTGALVFEIICLRFFVAFYYRKGVPLYRDSFSLGDGAAISTEALAVELESKFYPTSIFRRPVIFADISDKEVGFRNSLYMQPLLIVMKGVIRIDTVKRTVTVTGYLNWYILTVPAALLLSILTDLTNGSHVLEMIGFVLLFALYAGVSWYFEYQFYPKVVDYLDSLYGK